MASRTLTAVVGLVASLALSVVLWVAFDVPLFLLFVPFVPFLFRRGGDEAGLPAGRECPECGFATRDPEVQFCPRDGTRLE